MAIESVATNPEFYGADPVHGNFTAESDMHLWCAEALACVVSNPTEPMETLNDDLQDALRYLLRCEIARARKAVQAENESKRA